MTRSRKRACWPNCCRASSELAALRRKAAQYRPHHRCRGGQPARSVARAFRQARARPALAGWNGLGLAVQAYGKRAMPVLEWLAALGARDRPQACRFASSRAPIGTPRSSARRKRATTAIRSSPARSRPMSAISPARAIMLSRRDVFYPQFATHNAHTLAAVSVMAGNDRDFEFQRLHGMGQALYEQVVGRNRDEPALPHLCAGRQPRGSARLSGAAAARERRQHVLRQPPCR